MSHYCKANLGCPQIITNLILFSQLQDLSIDTYSTYRINNLRTSPKSAGKSYDNFCKAVLKLEITSGISVTLQVPTDMRYQGELSSAPNA